MSRAHSRRRKLLRKIKKSGGSYNLFRATVADMVLERQGQPICTLQQLADGGHLKKT